METLAWDGWHEEGKDPQGRQNLNTFSVFEEDLENALSFCSPHDPGPVSHKDDIEHNCNNPTLQDTFVLKEAEQLLLASPTYRSGS